MICHSLPTHGLIKLMKIKNNNILITENTNNFILEQNKIGNRHVFIKALKIS